jgi:hypothetical protein
MNTLDELDQSGLTIRTSSVGNMDIFGKNDSILLESLRSKLKLLTNKSLNDTAYARTMCSVERKADINVAINVSEAQM